MTAAEGEVTILVIDDDPDVLAYLGAVFSDRGYRVLTAGDGGKGLDLARREGPDLICLDISMPPPTGVRVYRETTDDVGMPYVRGYRSGLLGRELVERGKVSIKRPGRMRWEYQEPEEKLFNAIEYAANRGNLTVHVDSESIRWGWTDYL